LRTSPAHLRDERQEEVTRLERALKRSESNVERAKRQRSEAEALRVKKKEERELNKQGKGVWHMKKCAFLECFLFVTLVTDGR
jgi:ribosomal RNA-processing protein 36